MHVITDSNMNHHRIVIATEQPTKQFVGLITFANC
jgi:hypothetical protein